MARTKKENPPAPPTAGIRELVWVDPQTLDENPLNWRKHPNRQKNAIGASIKANGWADTLLFNETTGRLIDGHARRAVAIREGIDSVPVLVGAWTEEQEKHLLATLDPMAAMAETDAGALSTLTDMIKQDKEAFSKLEEKDQEILETVTEEIDTYAFNVSIGDDRSTFLPKQKIITEVEQVSRHEGHESAIVLEIDEDVIFHSDNEWGIPDLLEEGLTELVPEGTWDRSEDSNLASSWYCQSARPFPKDREGGILGFFTEDYRFETYWNNKTSNLHRLASEEWGGVCTPDFSVYSDQPFAVQLHNVYRSRWLARFWQEAGIPILPTIQGMSYDKTSHDWILETLPLRPPVIALQCRTITRRSSSKRYWTEFHQLIEDTVRILQPKVLVLYGGIELKRHLGAGLASIKSTEFVLLDSYMTKRRHKIQEEKNG
tara:strand:+ start:1789 stop:3081 length:1293 start_codon:yes stop_codon:yes gene_type:complete